jgi:Asp-tRNA(Asn)/Glu-tRNA(Gln) amidotransferase A subunit family amidase
MWGMSVANLPAAEALARLRKRTLTAEALARACLARIEERDPRVQAWVAIDREDAIAQARRIDGMRERPLLCGLPVGIKDLIDTHDLLTTYGSAIYAGHRPARDAACVRALREAGAVILGKTVTTEFAVYWPGPTRNPRDLSRTPGGSSSGSAAAVADFMVPAAIGTQTAASVIRPGSFCGVVAMKPTFGILSLEGVHPLAPSFDTLGVFVREVDDLPPLLAAMGMAMPESIAALEKPRLGLCRTELWERAEPSTRTAVEQAAAALERKGARVREVDLGRSFRGLAESQISIMGSEAAQSLRLEQSTREADLSPRMREFLRQGAAVPAERLREAHEHAARCRGALAQLFAGLDAVLTPAAVGEAPLGIDATGDPIFSRIWTLLRVPSVSVPVLQGPAGMPLGLQLVAEQGADARLLAAAKWVDGNLRRRS